MTSPFASGLRVACPRCGLEADPTDPSLYQGCPDCGKESLAVNLVARLPRDVVSAALTSALDQGPQRGIWRWAGAMPIEPRHGIWLGEGDTPLVDAPSLAGPTGVRRVTIKNESANPTWSHKDRLSALTVSAARAIRAPGVVAASTGNHGASLAAYAARAGLPCTIYTLESVPETMKTLMQAFAAHVVAVPTSNERYTYLDRDVSERGWFPGSNAMTPPVGSHPLGVAGYRSLAYEIFETCRPDPPDVVVVPVAYGDCLAGLEQGIEDLIQANLIDRSPLLVGAEVFGALGAYLKTGGVGPVESWPTAAFSIAAPYATWQSADAITRRHGYAITVGERQLAPAQADLAQRTGIFVEAASAAGVAALPQVAELPGVGPDSHVLIIATSSGMKDTTSIRSVLPEVINAHA